LVGEIAPGLPASRPAESCRLRVLGDAGLVQAHEQGARNIYAIRLRGFTGVREFACDAPPATRTPGLARAEDIARNSRTRGK